MMDSASQGNRGSPSRGGDAEINPRGRVVANGRQGDPRSATEKEAAAAAKRLRRPGVKTAR